MDELIRSINGFPNGTIITVSWKNGLTIQGSIDTLYESDNGLETTDPGYEDFYVCLLTVLTTSEVSKSCYPGALIEISMQEPPFEVSLHDGSVIWRNID